MKHPHVKFYADLLERTLWSFVGGFAGGYIGGAISGPVTDLPLSARLSIGVGAGLVSVFKGLAAVQLPWTANNSASVLPERLDPPAGEDGLTLVEVLVVVLAVAVVLILMGRL